MFKRFIVVVLILVLGTGSMSFADEGMWLFNAFPKDKVKAKYGFEATQPWLDHLRLSSARTPNGSASFVSADGLVFTNHHVAQGCIHDLSTNGKDYMKDGFYAPTRAEEPKCPGIEFIVLQDIQDVTDKVNGAVKPEMPAADAGKAQREEMSSLEKECSVNGLRCDVVTLYSGALYHLYKYKKYDDVRLVFAPEFDIAFFGGDPDNFEYPRYDLDITFFRVYENGQPAKIHDYLHWAQTGVKEGDLVFISGHPGATGRLQTMAQLQFLRDQQYPWQLQSLARRIEMLQKFSSESPENARQAEHDLFSLQNAFKAFTGYLGGLKDADVMSRKAAEEKALEQYVNADPKRKQEIGDPWSEIAKAVDVQKQIYLQVNYLENLGAFRGTLATYARTLVRITEEKTKPNNARLRGYQDSALPTLEGRLFSTAPVYKNLEQLMLAESLQEAQEALGPSNPALTAALAGKTPQQRAEELIAGTKLDDVSFRKQLYEGGKAAVDASADPLIVLMRNVDPEARAIRKRSEDEVESVLRRDGGLVAKARFQKDGLNVPPDATFTLRLSYGTIKGYRLNGKDVPWFTPMGGAFQHAGAHGNKPPYQLPASWLKAKTTMNARTPLDTVSTADIIGGNSGSPVVNRNGELVGIIFDVNIESLAWNFMYSDKVARAIEVDSRAVIEALRNVYHATALADELAASPAVDQPGVHNQLRKPLKPQK